MDHSEQKDATKTDKLSDLPISAKIIIVTTYYGSNTVKNLVMMLPS